MFNAMARKKKEIPITLNFKTNQKAIPQEALEIYLSLGHERSLRKTREILGNRSVSLRILEKWSSQDKWAEKVKEYEEKLYEEVTKDALEVAKKNKAQILVLCKGVLARFLQDLTNRKKPYKPTMEDIERIYRIFKKELGEW